MGSLLPVLGFVVLVRWGAGLEASCWDDDFDYLIITCDPQK